MKKILFVNIILALVFVAISMSYSLDKWQTKWDVGGTSICVTDYNKKYPYVITDGQGGAIIAWQAYNTSNSMSQLSAKSLVPVGTVVHCV